MNVTQLAVSDASATLPGALVQLERPLLELDRPLVLAFDHRDLAQPRQRLRALTLLEDALEARPRPLPISGSDRILALAEQARPRRNLHQRR